jgi:hypothetical protein
MGMLDICTPLEAVSECRIYLQQTFAMNEQMMCVLLFVGRPDVSWKKLWFLNDFCIIKKV